MFHCCGSISLCFKDKNEDGFEKRVRMINRACKTFGFRRVSDEDRELIIEIKSLPSSENENNKVDVDGRERKLSDGDILLCNLKEDKRSEKSAN